MPQDMMQDSKRKTSADLEKLDHEERRRTEREAEEHRKREKAEIAVKLAAKAAAEERLRHEAVEHAKRKEVEDARSRREAELEHLRQQDEEERLRHQAEEMRLRQEAAEVEAAVQANKRIAFQNAQNKIGAWCKTHGYEDVFTPKTTLRGNKKYVLHTAVKHVDATAIEMLLLCGAKRDVKDSKGQTAVELAQKIKSGRQRELMVAALS